MSGNPVKSLSNKTQKIPNTLTLCLKKLEKLRQTKPTVGVRKEIKVRAKIST
jgi:hypothetical protein